MTRVRDWLARSLAAPEPRPLDGLGVDSPESRAGARWWRNAAVRGLVFIVVFMVMATGLTMAESVLPSPAQSWVDAALELVSSLVAYACVVLVVEGRRRPFEIAPRRSPGLLAGMLLGGGACVVIVWFLAMSGALLYLGVNHGFHWGLPLWQLGISSAISEEIIFRSMLYRLVESGVGTWGALAVSSVLFGAVHLSNPDATVWGAVAIALEAGVMFGALYTLTRSLWVVVGVHFAWNVMEGPVLGSVVSGSSSTADSWLISRPAGPGWFSGGSFGIEGSVVTVILWGAVSAWLIVRIVREHKLIQPAWVRRRPTVTPRRAATKVRD